MAGRFSGPGQAYEGLARQKLHVLSDGRERLEGRWTGKVAFIAKHLPDPLKWKRPRRIFVNSMSDLFHEELSAAQIAAVFGVMAMARNHTFQVLTKRPALMLQWFAMMDRSASVGRGAVDICVEEAREMIARDAALAVTVPGVADGDLYRVEHANVHAQLKRHVYPLAWPLPNVWIGVTAEDQQRADERVPLLLRTPAAKRFVSVEPQLGPVQLDHVDAERGGDPDWCVINALTGTQTDMGRPCRPIGVRLDWVITGAESGPGARPYELQWARMLREQCQHARAAFFLKQIIVDGKKVSTPPLDGAVHAEFPS